MTTINVYLTFNGDCEQAFDHYKSVFGGDYQSISRFGEMPPQEGIPPVPDDQKDKIMHVSLPISEETILMGSDAGGEWGKNYQAGNNFSISISTETIEEGDRIFAALSEGGEVTMPMDKTFWGSYFGMFRDKFGINWMINVNLQTQ